MEPELWALIGTLIGWISSGCVYLCTKKCRHSEIASDCCGVKFSAREDTKRNQSNQPSLPAPTSEV